MFICKMLPSAGRNLFVLILNTASTFCLLSDSYLIDSTQPFPSRSRDISPIVCDCHSHNDYPCQADQHNVEAACWKQTNQPQIAIQTHLLTALFTIIHQYSTLIPFTYHITTRLLLSRLSLSERLRLCQLMSALSDFYL